MSSSHAWSLKDRRRSTLPWLQHLESLVIRNASIGDATAAAIATLTRLRQLCLVGTRISAKSLPQIGRLPALRWLELAPSNNLSQESIVTLRHKLQDRCFVDCLRQ